MSHDNLQKPLQPSSPLFNHRIVEPVQIDFPGQGRNGNSSRFSFEQVSEHLEIGVSAADFAAAELEGGDVGGEADQVGGVARGGRGGRLVGLGFCDL